MNWPVLKGLLLDHLRSEDPCQGVRDVGTIISLGDGIARVYGCEDSLAGELFEFSDGSLGLALNLETQTVG